MANVIKYSVIIPVYNRPEEVSELLESLLHQSRKNFEVLLIEDGSSVRCDHVAERYQPFLNIRYFFKQNEGPGPARNFGFASAAGEYFVIFDSDCILPPEYFEVVDAALSASEFDAWGGPDRAHNTFTAVQRAMGYTMSSVLTTGGIRGGQKRVGLFQPRSFNMGISRKVFEVTGGFRFDRHAEDIEFSIRIRKAGFRVGLIPEAFVFHKRRTSLGQFFRQVSDFGKGRVLIGSAHQGEVKLTHWFPSLFLLSLLLLCLLPLISFNLFLTGLLCFSAYLMAVFFHSFWVNRSLTVALLSVPSAVVQLSGYGFGFLKQQVKSYFK